MTDTIPLESEVFVNTDIELWRQPTTDFGKDDGSDSGMEPYVFVTKDGSIGFNHYGTCVVMSIKQWVELTHQSATHEAEVENLKAYAAWANSWIEEAADFTHAFCTKCGSKAEIDSLGEPPYMKEWLICTNKKCDNETSETSTEYRDMPAEAQGLVEEYKSLSQTGESQEGTK